jgi:hypothetical protein
MLNDQLQAIHLCLSGIRMGPDCYIYMVMTIDITFLLKRTNLVSNSLCALMVTIFFFHMDKLNIRLMILNIDRAQTECNNKLDNKG